ncbi:MAG TPA: S8 family serine peptidase, partial [Tahibacter sp.]|nr:S8 family serine peptidase [Tahibacter sp.]
VRVHRGMGDPHDPGAYYRALRAAQSARLINLSLGGPHEDPLETRILERALRNGAIVVSAIGNDGRSGSTVSYPACLPDIIAVGAVDRHGSRAAFSSCGDHIALCAPGVDIYSTVPTYPVPGVVPVGSPPLATFSGTSMAAPIVTAVVAKMLSWNGRLTRDDVRRHLRGSSGRAWNNEVGLGVIDACATLEML